MKVYVLVEYKNQDTTSVSRVIGAFTTFEAATYKSSLERLVHLDSDTEATGRGYYIAECSVSDSSN